MAQTETESRGRSAMEKLWNSYSEKPTMESMMLNENAAKISGQDERQILDVLPDLQGKSVLELGAGIGRFTRYLATKCEKLHASDFIESFIDKNKEENAGFTNIEYSVDDATKLDFPEQSFDFVFTNWLFMYLTDEETLNAIFNMVKWLKPYGRFHMRESCTESSNRKKSTVASENPTFYRHISQYINFLKTLRFKGINGNIWKLNFTWTNSIEVYVTDYKNWRQVHFVAQKVPCFNDSDEKSCTRSHLLGVLGMETLQKQREAAEIYRITKKFLRGASSPLEPYALQCLSNCEFPIDVTELSVLSVGTKPILAQVSAFNLAAALNASKAVHLETDSYHYSALLDEANYAGDQRVRVLWSPKPDVHGGYNRMLENAFHCAIGIAVFASCNEPSVALENVTKCLQPGGKIIFLEPNSNDRSDLPLTPEMLTKAGYKEVQIEDVQKDVNDNFFQFIKDTKSSHEEHTHEETKLVRTWNNWLSEFSRWYLVQATL